ncbi:MAG: hypothetical protein V3R78_10505 [Thermodesulfobacteriota bacterium]
MHRKKPVYSTQSFGSLENGIKVKMSATRTNLKNKFFPKLFVISVVLLLLLSSGCSENAAPKSKSNKENPYWKKAKELYEKAKESGETVPEDMVDWAKEDIKRIGTWEYKIVFLDVEGDSGLEEELNTLGKERWECFWIEKRENRLTLFLKRPTRSYLKAIPAGEIWRFLPQGDS